MRVYTKMFHILKRLLLKRKNNLQTKIFFKNLLYHYKDFLLQATMMLLLMQNQYLLYLQYSKLQHKMNKPSLRLNQIGLQNMLIANLTNIKTQFVRCKVLSMDSLKLQLLVSQSQSNKYQEVVQHLKLKRSPIMLLIKKMLSLKINHQCLFRQQQNRIQKNQQRVSLKYSKNKREPQKNAQLRRKKKIIKTRKIKIRKINDDIQMLVLNR